MGLGEADGDFLLYKFGDGVSSPESKENNTDRGDLLPPCDARELARINGEASDDGHSCGGG